MILECIPFLLGWPQFDLQKLPQKKTQKNMKFNTPKNCPHQSWSIQSFNPNIPSPQLPNRKSSIKIAHFPTSQPTSLFSVGVAMGPATSGFRGVLKPPLRGSSGFWGSKKSTVPKVAKLATNGIFVEKVGSRELCSNLYLDVYFCHNYLWI